MPRARSAADAAPASASAPTGSLAAVSNPLFLRKLARLHLRARHTLSSRPGSTPLPRGTQASGIEVENYKAYGAGDDLRHLDWNAYGRLDQLVVRTFRAEREAPLHLVVDVSASMAHPPGDDKFGFAIGLAASLAYVSVHHHDPVCITAVSGRWRDGYQRSPQFRHRGTLQEIHAFLFALQAGGTTAIGPGIDAALGTQRPAGLAVVISDFLAPPAAYEAALLALVARRLTVVVVRVIGADERDPTRLFRRGELVDAESGRRRLIRLTAANVARYEHNLSAHLAHLRSFCDRHGIACCIADTGAGLEQALFRDLPAVGVLR